MLQYLMLLHSLEKNIFERWKKGNVRYPFSHSGCAYMYIIISFTLHIDLDLVDKSKIFGVNIKSCFPFLAVTFYYRLQKITQQCEQTSTGCPIF